MKVKPLSDNVLIERTEVNNQTTGGIFIPDSSKKKSQEGNIIAIGTGKYLDNGQKRKLSVKVNDRVIFNSYGGNEIKIDGKEFLIMKEEEILAVIED